MSRIVIGRSHGWTEKDFQCDISGDDYAPAAEEVAEYWDDVDQATLVSTLKGIFAMTGTENLKFVNGHTYEVDTEIGATTLNNGIQKALGDNKAAFELTCMHSKVATTLENLKLIEYMKYTDADGIERSLAIGTYNGRVVLVDDTMPTEDVEAVYTITSDTALDATKTYYTRSGSAGSYTYTAVTSPDVSDIATYYEMTSAAYTKYTTFVLGAGAIEYTNAGVKVPQELDRNAANNGGETTLYSRQRKVFAPYGISWKTANIVSPTATQLETGSNWQLANNNASSASYFPHKAIPIARIITRG